MTWIKYGDKENVVYALTINGTLSNFMYNSALWFFFTVCILIRLLPV